MEDLRERMRVETGLIVVGSADDYLRISKKKKRAEGITQNVVDRFIMVCVFYWPIICRKLNYKN